MPERRSETNPITAAKRPAISTDRITPGRTFMLRSLNIQTAE